MVGKGNHKIGSYGGRRFLPPHILCVSQGRLTEGNTSCCNQQHLTRFCEANVLSPPWVSIWEVQGVCYSWLFMVSSQSILHKANNTLPPLRCACSTEPEHPKDSLTEQYRHQTSLQPLLSIFFLLQKGQNAG